MGEAAEKISLYFREGSSDKEYHAAIEPQGGGYVVNCAWGRRGATLQTGTKTESPVPFDKAKKIYDKVVAEKTAKGYTPSESGTAYLHTDKEQAATGITAQLLNFVEEPQVEPLLASPAHCAQRKVDGKRILLVGGRGAVSAVNKRGITCGFPESFREATAKAAGDGFLIDGEGVGETYHAFDILEAHGDNLRVLPYFKRFELLSGFVGGLPKGQSVIRVLPTCFTEKDKRELYRRLQAEGHEGIVFKEIAAASSPGRPNSGGSWLKFKFYAMASFLVVGRNDKRSIEVAVLDAGKPVSVGNVTVPPNKPVPKEGSVVEVRYLYAYPGGSIYQSAYIGERDDVNPSECLASQLKYKREED